MERIRQFFVESWKAKLVSLFIALSIWYLIKSHLDGDRQSFPVPGTTINPPPGRSTAGPGLEDPLLGPLIPAPLPPAPIPVPGGAKE